MTSSERELGEIAARLQGIERRLDENEGDMRELTKMSSELAKSVATLAARLTMAPFASPPPAPERGGLIGLAAGVGGVFGAAVTKALAFFGVP